MNSASPIRTLLVLATAALVAWGCGKKDENNTTKSKAPAAPSAATKPAAAPAHPPAAKPPTAASAAPSGETRAGDINPEAQTIFAGRCVACHGAQGDGEGVAGKALNPRPRNYTDAAWQESVTDEHIAKVIVGGGPSVGKSPLMPPNADLKDKPKVVEGLVKIVRGFGQKK